MKKILPYLLAILLFVIVIFAINPHYLADIFGMFNQGASAPTNKTSSEQQSATPSVSWKTISDKDTKGLWQFSATYPVLDTSFNNVTAGIDSQIQSKIQSIEYQDTAIATSTGTSTLPFSPPMLNITILAEATTSTKFNTVSILYSTEVDGGLLAHPFTDYESETFSISNGSSKNLNSFFTDPNYLNAISEDSTSALKNYYSAQGNADVSFLDNNTGLAPSTDNFNVFMISNDNLVLQFKEYQLGSRPYGAPRIYLPLSNL